MLRITTGAISMRRYGLAREVPAIPGLDVVCSARNVLDRAAALTLSVGYDIVVCTIYVGSNRYTNHCPGAIRV